MSTSLWCGILATDSSTGKQKRVSGESDAFIVKGVNDQTAFQEIKDHNIKRIPYLFDYKVGTRMQFGVWCKHYTREMVAAHPGNRCARARSVAIIF